MTLRAVPQILPGTALSVSTGRPRGSLAFPTAGGVQAIDETGAVLYVSTSSTPNNAALLSATQTFTGVNSFVPAAGTRVASVTAPLFDVDMSATQTLSATALVTQFGTRIKAPVFNKSGADDLDAAATFFISGPPTGTAMATALAFSLSVGAGNTFLGGDAYVGGAFTAATTAAIGGNLTFGGNYTVTIPSVANTPIVTSNGLDYTVQVRSTGILALDVGTATVRIGDLVTSLIGEYGHVGTAQSAAIPDAALGAVIDAEARAAINALLAYFRLRGTVAV